MVNKQLKSITLVIRHIMAIKRIRLMARLIVIISGQLIFRLISILLFLRLFLVECIQLRLFQLGYSQHICQCIRVGYIQFSVQWLNSGFVFFRVGYIQLFRRFRIQCGKFHMEYIQFWILL